MTSEDEWVADPSIAWRILLTATLPAPLTPPQVRAALDQLYAEQGWADAGRVVTGHTLPALQRSLAELRGPRVAIGLIDSDVVVSAHHSAVDGLGLLAVLAAVTGGEVTSRARGVGDRPATGGSLAGAARRLVEVAAAPPAPIATTGGSADDLAGGADGTGDAFAHAQVAGARRTAELVNAAARGVVAHNARLGAPTRRVAIAVGLSRAGGEERGIADHSALLRLRDVERLDLARIGDLLRTAPTQPAVPGGSGRAAGVVQLGLRLLAPRLGSTLLVSHLGTVTADGVEHLAFHPVTAGGSGVSLGAVTLGQTTTVTLRARGSAWTTNDLEDLLTTIVGSL